MLGCLACDQFDDFLATVAGQSHLLWELGLRCVAQWELRLWVASLLHTANAGGSTGAFSYVDNFQAWILQRLRHGFGRKVEEGS